MSNDAILSERQRIAAIITSDTGKLLPKLAASLAYETDVTPDAAAGILAAAVADKEAAAASKPRIPTIDPNRQRQPSAAGIGMPAPTNERPGQVDAGIGWRKAVANANRGPESLLTASGGATASAGWSKAVAYASRGVA